MILTSSILLAEFELLKSELIAKYDELGMRATGNWANSLTIELIENSVTIKGEEYTNALEYGRKPGKQPPSEAIEQWLVAKGIAGTIEGDITLSSLAYLIARKIAREGYNRAQHGGTELISTVITPQRIQQIINKVSDNELANLTQNLTSFINNTFL